MLTFNPNFCMPSEELRQALLKGLIANDREYLMQLYRKKEQLYKEFIKLEKETAKKEQEIASLVKLRDINTRV